MTTPSVRAEGVVVWGTEPASINSTAMPGLLSLLLPLPLVLAAMLAGRPSATRLAWLGALSFALGSASVRVALRLPIGAAADPLWVAALPIQSLRIDAGLELLGALLALAVAAWGGRPGATPRDRASALLALASAIAMVASAEALLRIAGWLPSLVAALALGAALAAVGGVAVTALRRIARHAQPSPVRSAGNASRVPWRALLLAGAGAALAAPHLDPVLGGAALAAAAAHMIARRPGAASIPLFPVVALAALAFAGYYLHVIAGPEGVSLASLPEAPLSRAAQALIVPALAIAAAGFFGFWPLRTMTPGPWLAPIGAALLLRIAVHALPLGIEGWRTVAIPIGVVAAWASALTASPYHLAAAGAWMACFASAGGGAAGAWMLALVPLLGMRRASPDLALDAVPRPSLRNTAAAVLGILGGVLALDGLLRVEVVYTVFAAAAAALSAVYIPRADT